jgi:hypothetical protein
MLASPVVMGFGSVHLLQAVMGRGPEGKDHRFNALVSAPHTHVTWRNIRLCYQISTVAGWREW